MKKAPLAIAIAFLAVFALAAPARLQPPSQQAPYSTNTCSRAEAASKALSKHYKAMPRVQWPPTEEYCKWLAGLQRLSYESSKAKKEQIANGKDK